MRKEKMKKEKVIGEKLREVQNYYAKNGEKAFEEWVDAVIKAKETELTVAALRGSTSYTYSRLSEPANGTDTIPPFPSFEELREIEKRLSKKHGMKVEILEPNICKVFSIVFDWGKEEK